ncbi:MAG TPA: hypothetical protein VFU86_20960 [Terriglobales bacterium]|nr:hypothetical protein [Terriglobales bacterium]
MKHRLALWASAGLLVGAFWVVLSLKVPISPRSVIRLLAEITCPIALLGRYPIKWYTAVAANGLTYLLVGLLFEALLRARRLRAASA